VLHFRIAHTQQVKMDSESQRLKYRRSVERHACLARLNVPVYRTLTEDMQAYSPTFVSTYHLQLVQMILILLILIAILILISIYFTFIWIDSY
jgi:hypothetical protein